MKKLSGHNTGGNLPGIGSVTSSAVAFVLMTMLLLMSRCGGEREREEDPIRIDEKDDSAAELLSYREAGRTLTRWLGLFDGSTPPADAFELLTSASKQNLRKSYAIRTGEQFGTWFLAMRDSGIIPFSLIFSNTDVKDINPDSRRATITALVTLRNDGREIKEFGSFFLVREGGRWAVPFAEASNWISRWWERGSGSSMGNRDEGMITYRSSELDLQITFPRTWDLSPTRSLYMPYAQSATHGLEIVYYAENEVSPRIRLRITILPQQSELHPVISDTVSAIARSVYLGPASLPAEQLSGKLYRRDLDGRSILAFACTDENASTLELYDKTIRSVIESIQSGYERH